MGVETQIHLNRFVPRPYQLPVMKALEHDDYHKIVCILPRRAGKDLMAWNMMIRMAIKRIAVYHYVFPTYQMGKKILWDSLTNDGIRFIDFIPPELIAQTNSQEMKIRLINGSLIQIVGSDNFDSLVGTNAYMVIFSEYALQDPRAYSLVYRPILTANAGYAVFVSTPRGKNHLFEMWQIAQHNPEEWFSHKLTVEETAHIPLWEIEKEKADGLMSDDLIQQEYYCFPADQLVLTPSGIEEIGNIKEDDLVISHKGRPRKVISIISRDYDGDMIEIKSYGSADTIVCTPNHPLRIYNMSDQTYSWKNAELITNEDRLVFPKLVLHKIPIISYELCMLIAWYISDGSSFMNGLQFTVNLYKSKRVIELLERLSIPYFIHDREEDSVENIVVNSTQLVDFFKVHCGVKAHDKRIPFSLISSFEDDFFHELMRGDGCFSQNEKEVKFSFTTISKHKAYIVQLLSNGLLRRYAAGITKRDGGRVTFPHGKTYMTQPSYNVQIHIASPRDRISWLIRGKYGIAAKIKSIKKTHFKGKVYNLSVQFDESYVVAGRSVHNCSFDLGIEGSYYSKYLDRMRLRGAISDVPWEASFKVHSSFDLGIRDATSIIFFQVIGQSVRIIDTYENSGYGLDHYIKVLEQKPYTYGKHIAPHDIMVRELGTGMSRLEKARSLGIKFTVAPNLSIEDGIEAVRSTTSKMWIDSTKCKDLIKALENYRKEYDPKKKTYKSNPLHDWSSHFCDSLRYLCISLPKTADGLTPEELDRRYNEAMMGPSGRLPSFFRDNEPRY